MFKFIVYIVLLLSASALLIGCFHLYRVSEKNKKELEKYAGEEIEVNKSFGKTLVVYYSFSGKTKAIAEKIRDKTNADIYEISTVEELKMGPKFYIKAKRHAKSGEYFEIKKDFSDIDSYDVIFVGAPVWWYTMASPVVGYLAQTDFKGKKVVPFSTQGSNVGTFFEDFKAKAKNAVILQGVSFNNLPKGYERAEENKISVWLNELDL